MLFKVQSISFIFMINANSLILLIILPSDTPCRKYYLCICLKTPTFSFVSFRPHFYSPHLSSSFTLYSSHVLSLVGCIPFSTEEKNNNPWLIHLLGGIFKKKNSRNTWVQIRRLPTVFQLLRFFFKLHRFERIEHQFSITNLWSSFP